MKPALGILVVIAMAGALCSGCGMVEIKGHSYMKVTKNGETVMEKEVAFDSLEELPGALMETANALGMTTAMLIGELTEVPPPRSVRLSTLDPGLARFEGLKGFDFLMQANQEAGVDKFRYVQIGVPSYDMFFKNSAEFYALVFQTTQTVGRMRKLAGRLLGSDVSTAVNVNSVVERALGVQTAPQNMEDKLSLQLMVEMASMLTKSVETLVAKTNQLVASGEQLIMDAPASITNPKTVLHLDLIVQGLKESVAMIVEAGKLVLELVNNLTGF